MPLGWKGLSTPTLKRSSDRCSRTSSHWSRKGCGLGKPPPASSYPISCGIAQALHSKPWRNAANAVALRNSRSASDSSSDVPLESPCAGLALPFSCRDNHNGLASAATDLLRAARHLGGLGMLELGCSDHFNPELKSLIVPLVFVEQIGPHLLEVARLQYTAVDVPGLGQAKDVLAVTIGITL